jgi:hypothetical protein
VSLARRTLSEYPDDDTINPAIPYKTFEIAVTIVAGQVNGQRPLMGTSPELRGRDSNPNFRSQNPASYH